MARRLALLITATVRPNVTLYSQRNDPDLRLSDYLEALRSWSKCPVDDIVFCENSGYDLEPIRDLATRQNKGKERSRIHVIQFTDTDSESFIRGKGFGEIGIMEKAFELAPLLRDASLILKGTGRYSLQNAEAVFAGISRYPEIAILGDLHVRLSWADSRFFGFCPGFFFDHLLPRRSEVDDRAGQPLEKVLARAILAGISQGLEWRPLPVFPDIRGTRAGDEKPWESSRLHVWSRYWSQRLKNTLNEQTIYELGDPLPVRLVHWVRDRITGRHH